MRLRLLLACLVCSSPLAAQDSSFDSLTSELQRSTGLLPYYLDTARGRVLAEVPRRLGEIIYVESLAAGVGSNDLGLDRGQLGDTRVVRFERAGGKLLLVEPNQGYRAVSDNEAERASVAEAFAQSVLWGFPILASRGDSADLVDLSPFLLQDAHGLAELLADMDQGEFKIDPTRCALYAERTRNFPRNTEFEAIITLTGEAEGGELRSVTPSSGAVTTRQHHSFVALPPPGYRPRAYDIRSGYFPLSFADYATPIGAPLVTRYIRRHRLEKADPSAALSAPVEPIVYYVDRGAPEPVKSALIEGASWWNAAFAAAGFTDAFRVEELPEGVDPLDVRYNVIQWVHRSTRGWSYGASVTDPRTGEIVKGHVSLGSLRVRQDYLIAQGLIDAYRADGTADPRLLKFALARLRQLSAHEVGHTLGLAHNFAASGNDRASVMDYPHPLVELDVDGEQIVLDGAYATGIGRWDVRAIRYGYGDFAPAAEADSLAAIVRGNAERGLDYLSDADARPVGGASPRAHLWDNGADATAELARVSELRRFALDRLDANNLAPGRPLAELESVLVPVYLAHRYQVEACAKTVGGVQYGYAVNDASAPGVAPVAKAEQEAALAALLETLRPGFLALPETLSNLIAPLPPGYARDRELFASYTDPVLDPWAAAEASVDQTLTYLLAPERITRVLEQHAAGVGLDPAQLLNRLASTRETDPRQAAYGDLVRARTFEHALTLASDRETSALTQAWGYQLARRVAGSDADRTGRAASPDLGALLRVRLRQWELQPDGFTPLPGARIPDGSPIGCGD